MVSHDMGTETTSTLTLSLPQDLKDALEQRAKDQDRSVSSLVRVILKDTLGIGGDEPEASAR